MAMRSIEGQVNNYLLRLKFNPKLKGYRYLREAILIALEHEKGIYTLKNDIYPRLAEKFAAGNSNLERDMANAIDAAFLNIGLEDYESLFGNTVNAKSGKPTVKELISAASIHISLNNFSESS